MNISTIKKTVKVPDLSSIKESITRQEEEYRNQQPVIGSDHVTIAQLKAEWQEFMKKLQREGREREYNTLNQQVAYHEDLSIKLTLPNSFQSLTIEALQQELLTHLRTKLNNKEIQLITEIEKIEDKKLIYTNSEKFEYLAEKYPDLRQLKTRLDLDPDF